MATITSNLKLTKPSGNENVSVTVLNENFDKIDSEIGSLQTDYVDTLCTL